MWGMFADCAAFTQPLDSGRSAAKPRNGSADVCRGRCVVGACKTAAGRREQFFSRLAPHVNCDTGDLILTEEPGSSTGGASSR